MQRCCRGKLSPGLQNVKCFCVVPAMWDFKRRCFADFDLRLRRFWMKATVSSLVCASALMSRRPWNEVNNVCIVSTGVGQADGVGSSMCSVFCVLWLSVLRLVVNVTSHQRKTSKVCIMCTSKRTLDCNFKIPVPYFIAIFMSSVPVHYTSCIVDCWFSTFCTI